MSQQKGLIAPKKSAGQRVGAYISWLIVLGLVLWSTTGMNFDLEKALHSMPTVKNIFKGLFHPEWSFFNESEGVVDNMIITLETAFLGTSVAALLAVPFGFLAARNMSKKYVWISWFGKRILNIIRTLPELIIAIIFLVAVGPGPFAGMLAIGFHSIGMIGKLYSEAIENMDEGPMEALTAVGANRIQTLFFSVLPQVLPEFFSFALYKFEIDVRAASVLGMVGAGGIGTPLLFALQSQDWARVGIIFIGIVIAVVIIDFISGSIRKRLV
ncbi:phosphonate ABC transporter, permease protein PhnE [Tumebacillus permanentifrigoris]|uniref:Phosphonate transport system permease protein n=1 Tax=Tumebacillus permanentifrigoris TaxID=378543 RepID=A0A316D703_9BACL|nr:phosphonate ABC transporter, permease protein PhnE [Tumebacillus permanentifrigoris]PWK11315.1 phosphonate transport system permease protein [Tumebacillus permanentifrigoris]